MVAGKFRDMHRIRPFENRGREPKMVRALPGARNAWPQLAAHAWARDRGRPARMSPASSSVLLSIECRILPQTIMRNMHFAILRNASPHIDAGTHGSKTNSRGSLAIK